MGMVLMRKDQSYQKIVRVDPVIEEMSPGRVTRVVHMMSVPMRHEHHTAKDGAYGGGKPRISICTPYIFRH